MTQEEFTKAIENLEEEYRLLSNRRNEIIDYYLNQSEDLANDEEYSNIRDRQLELRDTCTTLKSVITDCPYYYFMKRYDFTKNYFAERGVYELPFLEEKRDLLAKEYLNSDVFELEKFSLHPYQLDDYKFSNIEEDIKKAIAYFKKRNRDDYIYIWEVEYFVLLMLNDKMEGTNLVSSIFGDISKISSGNKELIRNFQHILNEINNDHVFNYNLFFWSFYKTYDYLYEQRTTWKLNKEDFILISYLLDIAIKFANSRKFSLTESYDEKITSFVLEVSELMSLDLIHTVMGGFPDYYSKKIMFLGYGLYTPAGCSELNAQMSNFKSFIEGACDYDFWVAYEEGKNIFFDTIKICFDYKQLIKQIYGED